MVDALKQIKKYNSTKILAIALSIHVVISTFLILLPSPVGVNNAINLYRRYLLPGPFFSDKTITETHLLLLIPSGDERIQSPVNPTYNHYNLFFTNWNPTQMYRTRLERSVYEDIHIATEYSGKSSLGFSVRDLLKYYAKDQDIPNDFDSGRMILLKRDAIDFQLTTDTLQNIKF